MGFVWFNHATQNNTQFKTCDLFISGIFHVIFLDNSWPQVNKNHGSRVSVREGYYTQREKKIMKYKNAWGNDTNSERWRCNAEEEAGREAACFGQASVRTEYELDMQNSIGQCRVGTHDQRRRKAKRKQSKRGKAGSLLIAQLWIGHCGLQRSSTLR